ncbi:MAG: hypothetical protein WC044_05355 [Crocinitomicaceae bacterium]
MKKSILFICLLFVQGISFSQTMEIFADVRGGDAVKINSESTIIGDLVFSPIANNQSISVTNLKTKTRIEKKVFDLNSKIHNLSNLRNNYRNLIVISRGRLVEGNVQFLIQSMGKDDKVNLTRTTLDDELNVVNEILILSYDLAHTQITGPVRTDRIFKYDEQLKMYFYGEYYSVPRAEDFLQTVIFNSEMEMTAQNSFNLKNKDTELDPLKGFSYIPTSNIIDAETVVINIQGSLFRIKNKEFTPIPLELKKTIRSYVIHSNGEGGIRFVGCYAEDKENQGLAVIDFDGEMNVKFEKFQNIPQELHATQKELTGFGNTAKLKDRTLNVKDFKVNKNGSTDIVLYLENFIYLNFSFLKIDEQAKIIDKLVVPFSTDLVSSYDLIFDKEKIIIMTEDNEKWFDRNGEFSAKTYPNRKSDNFILTAIIVPSENFGSYTRKEVLIGDTSLKNYNTKSQKLSFYNLKLEDGSYLMNFGEGSYRFGFKALYLGKIQF